MALADRWYKNAVIYGVDVGLFQDSDGDGVGDFQGLVQRLDHIRRLGATCVWLLPFFPSPQRDNGYDIADYFSVAERHGTLGDFVDFLHEAQTRGIRVLVDLVANHTSDQHPWFQRARRAPRGSPQRSFYVWSDEPVPVPPDKGNIFPGVERGVWSWDEVAEQYFHHRFYHFEPSLYNANPLVQEQIKRAMGLWLQLGVHGFRLDAASHMIEEKGLPETRPQDPHALLRNLSEFVRLRRGNAILLAEADVEPAQISAFFGEQGEEMQMLFNFLLANYLFLGLAREEAEPVVQGLTLMPQPPEAGQYANFLRNLDELDLERLTEAQRADVFRALAPEPEMQIYGRGIRRRLAPMLGGDGPRLRMAYSLLFSLPGSPMIVYGDEIGMGDDLELPERNAVRTPMQWSAQPNAGFSTAEPDRLPWPVIGRGKFGYRRVNVADQRRDPDSLLRFMEQLARTRVENPEIGWGRFDVVETGERAVLAHRCDWHGQTVLAVHNLSREPTSVRLDVADAERDELMVIFGRASADPVVKRGDAFDLEPYGFRWFRVKTAE